MKYFMTGISLLITGSSLFAQQPYGMAGCGLGSVVWGPSRAQVVAYTTNYSSGQELSITTGTSNCVRDNSTSNALIQEDFFKHHLITLERDAARGQGESLQAFADTLGCDQFVQNQFNSTLKSNHRALFSAPGAVAILEEAKKTLRSHPLLVKSCRFLTKV